MDDRIKRRIKEMDKIRKTGTSTEFDRGYIAGIIKTIQEIKDCGIQSYTDRGNITSEFEKLEKKLIRGCKKYGCKNEIRNRTP